MSLRAVNEQRAAASVAAIGSAAIVGGAFATWIKVAVRGLSGPGSTMTGLDGRDGRTVVVCGLVGFVAAVTVALLRRATWQRAALFIAGGVATIVAAVAIVDVSSKVKSLEKQFGIPADNVTARVGPGLWLVAIGGVLLLAAALLASRDA
jgi:hypothetical protein